MIPPLTFVEACHLIKNEIQKKTYRVIEAYHPKLIWAFKFEKGASQYDAVELLFILTHPEVSKLPLYHIAFNRLDMKVRDKVMLHNCAYRNRLIGAPYDEYYRTFTTITGISI